MLDEKIREEKLNNQRSFTPKILKKSVEIMKNKYRKRSQMQVGERLYKLAQGKSAKKKGRSKSRSTTPLGKKRAKTPKLRGARKSMMRNSRKNSAIISKSRRRKSVNLTPFKIKSSRINDSIDETSSMKKKKKLKINSISSTVFLKQCEEDEKKFMKKKRKKGRRKSVMSKSTVANSTMGQRKKSKPSEIFNMMLEESMKDDYMVDFVNTTPSCQKLLDQTQTTLLDSQSPQMCSKGLQELSLQSLKHLSRTTQFQQMDLNRSIPAFDISENQVKKRNRTKSRIRKRSKSRLRGKKRKSKEKPQETKENSVNLIMKSVSKLPIPREFMNKNHGFEDGKNFIEVNGVKIFYQEKSIANIINLNMRKRISFQ